MDRSAEAEFEGDPSAIASTRAFLRATLAAWAVDDLVELTVLLTSELATNAVLHARSAFTVALELRPPELTVEVRDASPCAPVPSAGAPTAEGGRGLTLVEALAARWGYRLVDGGKIVWFILTSIRPPRSDTGGSSTRT